MNHLPVFTFLRIVLTAARFQYLANSAIFLAELCLSKVPIEWVVEILERGQLWMQHPDGFIYFGEKYMSKVTQVQSVLLFSTLQQVRRASVHGS